MAEKQDVDFILIFIKVDRIRCLADLYSAFSFHHSDSSYNTLGEELRKFKQRWLYPTVHKSKKAYFIFLSFRHTYSLI